MAFANGEEPKVSASGGAMNYAATGVSTLNGAMGGVTTMVVDDANFAQTNASAAGGAGAGAASVVKIDADDNSGAGFLVTVDSAAPSFTIEAVATGSDGAAVIPFVPTYSLTGSPISGIAGTFTWDSFAAVLTALEFTLKNNFAPFNDEALTQHVRDAGVGDRIIKGSMTFRVRKDHLIHILNRKAFAAKALSLTVGGAAQSGTRLVVTMGQCEMDITEVQAPESGEATINASFSALGSSGNDALTLMHT